MRKSYIKIIILVSLILFKGFASLETFAEEVNKTPVLHGSVVVVPESFYGTWRVKSKLEDTDSPVKFKQQSLDLWNLSRTDNVITLSNPFNGANAEITIDKVNDNYVVFKKVTKYESNVLTDTVEVILNGDEFVGYDYIQIDTFSGVNGKIIKTEKAKYSIKGEKIAGNSII